MVRKKIMFTICFMIISISLLSGCTEDGKGVKQETRIDSKQDKKKNGQKNIHAPVIISNGEFGKIEGWLNDETIVYFTNSDQSSSLYTYNIYSGKKEKLYECIERIVSVLISPSRKRMLIHSSSSSNEGLITVIDKEGKSLISKGISSSEMTFVWNPFNEELILVSSFDDEWNFTVSMLNIQSKEISPSLLTKQPFVSWLKDDEWIYLDWNLEDLEFFAPIVIQKMTQTAVEQIDLTNVYQLFAFKDILLTLSVRENDQDEAVYTFFSNRLEPIQSLKLPQLTRYSDWLVPFHDFNNANNQFITFRPLTSGSIDTYREGFQLVRYQFDKKKEVVLLEGMENKPIKCSPDGNFCLYGYQLEKIIDLRTKDILSLVEGK